MTVATALVVVTTMVNKLGTASNFPKSHDCQINMCKRAVDFGSHAVRLSTRYNAQYNKRRREQ